MFRHAVRLKECRLYNEIKVFNDCIKYLQSIKYLECNVGKEN